MHIVFNLAILTYIFRSFRSMPLYHYTIREISFPTTIGIIRQNNEKHIQCFTVNSLHLISVNISGGVCPQDVPESERSLSCHSDSGCPGVLTCCHGYCVVPGMYFHFLSTGACMCIVGILKQVSLSVSMKLQTTK